MKINSRYRLISIMLVIVLAFSNYITISAADSYEAGFVTICNVNDNTPHSYKAIVVNDEVFVSSDDIATIINREAQDCGESIYYSDYYGNRGIDVVFDGTIWTRGITYEASVHNIDGEYFFPLEKLLYLANAQWCVEDNIVYIQLTENTIFEFINSYYKEILDNNITQAELLMNGESEWSNAAKSSFAAIFNDFDVRVFVPIWGAVTLTVEDYQNAMLQLAKDELEFLDEYGQNDLDKILEESSFAEIKSLWKDAQSVADLPEDVLSTTDAVNKAYLWIKDSKDGTKMFSEYNDLADFAPADLEVISIKMDGVSDFLTIANAVVNVSEIATRSKSWNEDFLAQIKILAEYDETGYDSNMTYYVKKASSGLLEEHEDTFTATTDACVQEAVKIMGEKLVDLTPAGAFTSILTTGLSVAKLMDEDFATTMDALELSNMVEWLIRIEHVAFTEMSRDTQMVYTKLVQGGLALEDIEHLRNTTMLSLRTNLRNKAFIYYLNTVRNKDTLWKESGEAKAIEQDILWNYAKIIELSETEVFDELLVLDSFENMYSNEYGCKRDEIESVILSETEFEIDHSNPDQEDTQCLDYYSDILDMFYSNIANNWSELDGDGWNEVNDPDSVSYLFYHFEDYSLSDVGYELIDLDDNGLPELIVSSFDEAETGMFYDLYTMVAGEVVHLASSGERDRYYLAIDNTINNSGSSGAEFSSDVNFRLDLSEGILKVNQAVIYDGYKDSENPWFYSNTDYYDESTYEYNYSVMTKISLDEATALFNTFPKNRSLELNSFDSYFYEPYDEEVVSVTGIADIVFVRIEEWVQEEDTLVEYAKINGVDTSGNIQWSYTTEKYSLTELSQVEEIGLNNDLYYFNASGTITALDPNNGQVVWENDDFGGASIAFCFGGNGDLFLCGYYGPHFCWIDSSGATIKRMKTIDEKYYWPVEIQSNDDRVEVTMMGTPNGYEEHSVFVNLD